MVLLILLAIALVIFLLWAAVNSSKMDQEEKERQERKKEYDSWKRNMETRWKAYDEARDAALAELEAKWGKCDKDIYVTSGDVFSLEDRVYAFEKAEKIVLGGTVYDFKDIIGFSLVNKSKTVFNTYATVKSGKDLGGMIMGGVAGKMIAGNAGAVIGALAADDDCDCETDYDFEEENEYKIYVNVDSISSPTVILDFGTLEEDAYEAANLLNVITRRNSL